jgi:DNA polymerase III epsilon subunit family exonuclease
VGAIFRPMNAPITGVELRPSGSLVEKAIVLLGAGPLATADLAAEVLSLRGNPRAAAAAVFTLLGSDPRVRVDGAGVWRLREEVPDGARPLAGEEFVVVDVETTGGSPARGHRVIEVAAVRVANGRVRETFSTLINPRCPIPRMITSLTGIAGDMVADAPPFEAVAPRLAEVLDGRVFVGHNASFDWRFISAEMERCTARTLAGRQLCTLRLARRMLPHLPSRSLGALADYFGLAMDAHHRALDDALATARLLLRFLDRLEEAGVMDWLSLEAFLQVPPVRRRRSFLPRSVDAS